MTAYATRAEFAQYGLPAKAQGKATTDDVDAVLLAVSAEFEGAIVAAGYTLPLLVWGADAKLAICKVSAWELLGSVIGISPEDPAAQVPQMRAAEGRAWFRAVARGEIIPAGIVDSSSAAPASPSIGAESDPQRGWGRRW